MIQSSHRICLAASWPNLSDSSLAGWAPVLGSAARALRAHPPNWIQTNLAPHGETKPVGLIESFGAPPQTPGRLRSKNVAGGSAPRLSLGLCPRPRWSCAQTPFRRGSGGGSPQRGVGRSPSGVWGGAPAGVWRQSPQQHSCGGAPNAAAPCPPPPPGYGIG